jgi:NADPH:quinone reductase-like Zn-dependent oxidoreductase
VLELSQHSRLDTGLRAALALALLSIVWGSTMAAVPTTQKQYQAVRAGTEGAFTLKLVEAPVRQPGANEVLVKVHAASLNRRDVFLMHGQYNVGPRKTVVPLSDGAGEVVAVGPSVTRVRVGDRVAGIFFQNWVSGRPTPAVFGSALGGQIDGMLQQYVTLSEQGVVKLPASLSYEEGSTLPCAGVTAWNGLFTRGRMQPGDYVLLEGTGGVSTFGLQFAVAAGARPIVTSSSDDKLQRAKELGAKGTVNYKKTPDWDKAVLEQTGGMGVQQVLEVGGKDTLPRALASIGQGAHIALIGLLGGFPGDISAGRLMLTNSTVSGIYVGSRADFEAMNAFIDYHHVKPVIDKVIPFDQAQQAFDLMESNNFFGKIVIRML